MGAHAAALANRLVEEAAEGSLHPGAAVLGLWGVAAGHAHEHEAAGHPREKRDLAG